MSWMAWTVPTAVFFAAIGLLLVVMTVWELCSPSVPRRGFLPMATTRGDRLFIALLSSAYLHILWLALTDLRVVIATGLALILSVVLMRWG